MGLVLFATPFDLGIPRSRADPKTRLRRLDLLQNLKIRVLDFLMPQFPIKNIKRSLSVVKNERVLP